MIQIVVTHKNGIQLGVAETIAFEAEKIVTTKAAGNACDFVYAGTIDRRVAPVEYRAANYKSQIDGYVTGTQVDLTVYDEANGTTSTLTVTEKFIEQIVDTYHMINNTKTACRQVKFREGAWLQNVVYVSNALSSLATAASTTTTTATPTTTTTTAAVTTTTTTAA